MPKELAGLQAEEKQLIFDAIPLVTILIAGADGNIDAKETAWAKKLTKIRGYKETETLSSLYKIVGETLDDRLAYFIDQLPGGTKKRTADIITELTKLNDILPKIDSWYAKLFYEDLVSFAKHVAEASGGFMGMVTINSKESELIDLPMINKL